MAHRKTEKRQFEDVDPSWKIAIVASMYYKEEIEGLIEGARTVFAEAGIPDANVGVFEAPGSFEVPLLGSAIAEAGSFDAMIGFGIILEGKTTHARLLAESTASAIMDIQIAYRIPFAFEILHVNDMDQARERCLGPGNKGEEAAQAVLLSLAQLRRIQS